MADAAETQERMLGLQKMRVTLVIMLSQETTKLLSRQQRLAGKEIELLCAERDLEALPEDGSLHKALARAKHEHSSARELLKVTEDEITRMEELLAKVDADIGALCQS